MGLNKSKGNMYEFVTHTWNTVKGACPHDCAYCYMKSIAKRFCRPQKPTYFDKSELKTNLGKDNFIFVGSSNDLFADILPEEWVFETLVHCNRFTNKYLFQTKNPGRIKHFLPVLSSLDFVVCTTIESDDAHYNSLLKSTPLPFRRSIAMQELSELGIKTYVTIEPVMDFDLERFVPMIERCHPQQVNIGADSGHNYLLEPPKEKIIDLIAELQKFTTVHLKTNLKRILGNGHQ